jgi:glycerone phosphate O-acyltransferase/fatty acyl-CoA reductase
VVREMSDNQIVQERDGRLTTHPAGHRMIAFYCSLVRAHVDCYWASMVYVLSIARNEGRRYETSSLGKFYDTVQWFLESLYGEKLIEDYEACSLESIRTAFATFEREQLIRITPGGKKKESVVEVLVPTQQLEGMENNIKFFRKSVYSSVLSPMEVAKSSLQQIPKL